MSEDKTRDKKEYKTEKVNLNDPTKLNVIRSKDFVDAYTNRVLVRMTNHELRLIFLNMFDTSPEGVVQAEEKCSAVMTLGHALALRNLLNKLINPEDARFRAVIVAEKLREAEVPDLPEPD